MFHKDRIRPFFLLILILISTFLFIYNVGNLTFVDEDEAAYAKVAQEMLERNDWIYPFCNYTPFIDKPPVIYWGIAISFKLFGINEFAIRFWHSIIGILAVLVTYLIAKELFNAKAGLFAGLILATSVQYFYQARMALCDIPLTFFITLSLYFFLLFFRRKAISFYYLSIIAIALATLTKGPIGAVIPVLIIGLYLFFTRGRLFLDKGGFHIFSGLLLFFGIVSPWFILQIIRYKSYFVKTYFFLHADRAIHPVVSSGIGRGPLYFYIFIIAGGFLPWSGIMVHSIGAMLRRNWYCIKRPSFCEPEKKKEIFLLIWAGVIFILFSVFWMKTPRYIMPIYPALAIISSKFFAKSRLTYSPKVGSVREEENGRNFLPFLLSIIFAPFIIAAIFIAKRTLPSDAQVYLPVLMPTFIILGLGILASSIFLLKNRKIAFAGFFITAFISYIALIHFAGIHFNKLRMSKPFAEKINQTINKGDKIIIYQPFYEDGVSLAFYTNHYLHTVNDEKELISFINSDVRIFCVAPESAIESLKGKVKINILEERAGRTLFTNR